MFQVFRYSAAAQLILPEMEGDDTIIDHGDLDGWRYIAVPQSVELLQQADNVALEGPVTEAEILAALRAISPAAANEGDELTRVLFDAKLGLAPLAEVKAAAIASIDVFAATARAKITEHADHYKVGEYTLKAAWAPHILNDTATKAMLDFAANEAEALGLPDAKVVATLWIEKMAALMQLGQSVNQYQRLARQDIEAADSLTAIETVLLEHKASAETTLEELL